MRKYPVILPKDSGKDVNLHPGVDVTEVQLPKYFSVEKYKQSRVHEYKKMTSITHKI